MMRFVLICAIVGIIGLAWAAPPPTPRPCEKPCQFEYMPVCAGPPGTTNNADKKSFGNACVLANYNCQNNASLVELSKGECPGGTAVRLA